MLSVAICCTATLLPLNPATSPARLREELEQIRLDALIVPGDAAVPDWATAIGESAGLFKVSKASSSFGDVALDQIRPARRSRAASSRTAQSIAAIFRTSGTTGASKRVPVTHENLIEMAGKMERWLALTPADRSSCILPIYYNAGFKATLLAPLLIGCSVALPASTSPRELDRWLSELRPTWLTAAPAFLQAVVEELSMRQTGALDHSLRFVLSTASYLPEVTRNNLERQLAVPVVEFYGLCEAGMMTEPALAPGEGRPGSVGRIPEGELAIRDQDGVFLLPGQTGEVALRGPSVTPGYLYDDIDSMPSGLRDGWLATGDLGTVDKDGFLTIVGRSKEIINRGGEKISPYDVERVLLCHPAVHEAAAFAVPHPRLGEIVGAAVVLNEGIEATSPQLIDFLYDRLAPFQVPRHIHFVESLPVGGTGKISRSQLSTAFADRQWPTEQPALPLDILIAEIWCRLLKRTDIGLDDDFFEIGGDSLQAAEMLLELEVTHHLTVMPADVRAQLTIRQLSQTLTSTVAARQEVMTRAKLGKGTPLFVCHGDFSGWGFYAFRLAELLKGDGPVYLLHSILDDAKGIDTIEEMARLYLPHVEAEAPSGPVRLVGYCHGGLTALEVAGCLERAGRTVDKVVLIDTFSLNARPVMRAIVPFLFRVGRFVPGKLGRQLRRGMPTIWVSAGRLMQADLAILRRGFQAISKGSDWTDQKSWLVTYNRAASRYLPPSIRAEVICLLSEECSTKMDRDAGPWRHLASSVRSEGIRGQHNTCISYHVGELAERLNRILKD